MRPLTAHEVECLTSGAYVGLLDMAYSTIEPLVRTCLWSGRAKGLAVSEDGGVMRMSTRSSYNDTFRVYSPGAVVLEYVCGIMEELRRQRLNRRGQQVKVILSSRADKHAILYGTFREIRVIQEPLGEAGEVRNREYSLIDIIGIEDDPQCVTVIPLHISPLTYCKRLRKSTASVADGQVAGSAFPPECVHMVFDTESAPPPPPSSSRRPPERVHPVLQIGWVLYTSDFSRRLQTKEELLKYDEGVWTGNGDEQGLNKFPPHLMKHSRCAKEVLSQFFAAVDRVQESGGCLVAHNIPHDLRQVRASAHACGLERSVRQVRTFDSMRSASRIMQLMERKAPAKWMRLCELVRLNGVGASPQEVEWMASEFYHHALADVLALASVMQQWPLDAIALLTSNDEL